MTSQTTPRQTTRMRKVQCSACGFLSRASAAQIMSILPAETCVACSRTVGDHWMIDRDQTLTDWQNSALALHTNPHPGA